MTFDITYIGGPTVLLRVGALHLLTDPTFDAAGKHYVFGFGTSSDKVLGPAVSKDALPPLDAVLLTHDQHDDNLDGAGREVLERAPRVLTTPDAARRLGAKSEGLEPWQSVTVGPVRITATPARHGPPLSRPFVGAVTGFILEWEGQLNGALYISGDTVWFSGIREVARRFKVGTAILHLGSAQFPLTGPVRFTFDAKDAVRAIRALSPRTVVPVHYEGWSHFAQGRSPAQDVFDRAALTADVVWLPPGKPVTLSV